MDGEYFGLHRTKGATVNGEVLAIIILMIFALVLTALLCWKTK